MGFIQQKWDSWKSALTGLGGKRDKRNSSFFGPACGTLDGETLEALYHENDLAATICDTYPEHALREGITLQIKDENELETKVIARIQELSAISKLGDSAVWGNVYGGGALLIGANDGLKMSEPLDLAKVRKVDYLTVLEKRDLQVRTYYANPLAPNFGEARTYIINNPMSGRDGAVASTFNQEIHESRFIFFHGVRTSVRRKQRHEGWSESKLQRIYEILRDFDVGFQGASLLLQEASQAVYGVKGLVDMLSQEGGQELLAKRFSTIDLSRSIARSMVIDAEEETFARVPVTFTGIPDTLDRFCSRLAAAAHIPVTILMGQAPSGLNATGASDIRAFYDAIEAYRTSVMKPAIERLVRILLAEAGQAEKEFTISFPPLYQPTELEIAQLRKTVADTDSVYIKDGVTTPEEIALSRFAPEGWSMETNVDLELREALTEDPDQKVDPDSAFTGVQITSMLEICQAVAEERIPRETGLEILIQSYPISPEDAEKIMASIGKGFKPKEEEPPLAGPQTGIRPAPKGAPAKKPTP